jgi:hypothetical protein
MVRLQRELPCRRGLSLQAIEAVTGAAATIDVGFGGDDDNGLQARQPAWAFLSAHCSFGPELSWRNLMDVLMTGRPTTASWRAFNGSWAAARFEPRPDPSRIPLVLARELRERWQCAPGGAR